MRKSDVVSVDRFDEILDADIEAIIAGSTPANTDLLALRAFVASLRTMAETPVSEEFVEFHAEESAAAATRRRADRLTEASLSSEEPLYLRVRRRLTTAAASLAMLLAATGMAWAADGAVPGDWNYGLDRALEAVGIGAGGDAERLAEQVILDARRASLPTDPSQDDVLSDRRVAPPGQTKDDNTPPGQTKDDNTPPGQTKDKNTPPGQTKDDNTPPGQTKDKNTPPGQAKKNSDGTST